MRLTRNAKDVMCYGMLVGMHHATMQCAARVAAPFFCLWLLCCLA